MASPHFHVLKSYIVTYIDVLGQSSRLERLDELLNNRRSNDLVQREANRTIGVVYRIREAFEKVMGKLENDYVIGDPAYQGVSPHKKAEVLKLTRFKYKFQYFSDTVVVYTPLATKDRKCIMAHLLGMLAATGNLMAVTLSMEIPIRGSVEIGWAAEWPGGGFYGPVLHSVYHLENDIAKYPRIVVGNKSRNYISSCLNNEDDGSLLCEVNKKQAGLCDRMIKYIDGSPTVDFLGQAMLNLGVSQNHDAIVKQGFDFVCREYEKAKRSNNSRLKSQYELLKTYYLQNSGSILNQ